MCYFIYEVIIVSEKSEKKENINVIVPASLKQRISEKAESLGMSLSSYIRFVVIKDLEK